MARVQDPVCGMTIESDSAAGQSTVQERTDYFCSQQCLGQFEADPGRYAASAKSLIADRADNLEAR